MRLFRDEEAARKAGAMHTGMPAACYWLIPVAKNPEVCMPAMVLTDRERALLEALEMITACALHGERKTHYVASEHIEAAEALIKSLNVDG